MRKILVFIFLIMLFSCSPVNPISENKPSRRLLFSEYLDGLLNLSIDESTTSFVLLDGKKYFSTGAVTISVNAWEDWYQQTSKRMREFSKEKLKNTGEIYINEILTTSTISGKVTITSEVSLFGETPGTDLSEHFYAPITYRNCGRPLFGATDYSVVHSYGVKPSSLEEFFFIGRVLADGDQIAIKDKPTTGVSSAWIRIDIPVDDALYKAALDENGNVDESKVTHFSRVLSGVVSLNFQLQE